MLLNEHVSTLSENGVSVKKRLEAYLSEHPSATLLNV